MKANYYFQLNFYFLSLFFSGVMLSSLAAVATGGAGATFTVKNNCPYTIWPATLSGNGLAVLAGGGFELGPNESMSFWAPPSWSGRFWARTHCLFSVGNNSSGACATGDCAGVFRCSVSGTTPVTMAEFTLGDGEGGDDFYDVSLVDGYNVGMGVQPSNEATAWMTGRCRYAGCVADLNERCPAELRVADAGGNTAACRSACKAFGAPEYCCTGAHGTPATCRPTRYSRLFKEACPSAYSYAYDDATSTFMCATGTADYDITFCP